MVSQIGSFRLREGQSNGDIALLLDIGGMVKGKHADQEGGCPFLPCFSGLLTVLSLGGGGSLTNGGRGAGEPR